MTGHTPDETGGRRGEQEAAEALRRAKLCARAAVEIVECVYEPIAAAVRADERRKIAAAIRVIHHHSGWSFDPNLDLAERAALSGGEAS